MDFMKWWTHGLANFTFPHCTPKQKRDNVKFIHGLSVLFMASLFIFAPSRSFSRYFALAIYILFAGLYALFGDCWVSQVEKEIFSKSDNPPAVLDPIITLIGLPKNKETRELTTRISYFFMIVILAMLTIRDIIGYY